MPKADMESEAAVAQARQWADGLDAFEALPDHLHVQPITCNADIMIQRQRQSHRQCWSEVLPYTSTSRQAVSRISCRRLSGASTSALAPHYKTHQPTSRGS